MYDANRRLCNTKSHRSCRLHEKQLVNINFYIVVTVINLTGGAFLSRQKNKESVNKQIKQQQTNRKFNTPVGMRSDKVDHCPLVMLRYIIIIDIRSISIYNRIISEFGPSDATVSIFRYIIMPNFCSCGSVLYSVLYF